MREPAAQPQTRPNSTQYSPLITQPNIGLRNFLTSTPYFITMKSEATEKQPTTEGHSYVKQRSSRQSATLRTL
jgi:hypothetical protein